MDGGRLTSWRSTARRPSRGDDRFRTDPATGETSWSGAAGDAAAEVAAARAAFPAWAAQSLAYRIEALRRFANVVRAREARIRRH